MQEVKKKKVILIVTIIALVAIIVTVGTIVFSCSAKRYRDAIKRGNWYDTRMFNTTIVIKVEDTQEDTIEIPLKDIKEYDMYADDVTVVEFHGNAVWGCSPQVGIVNDGVVVRETDYVSLLNEKDLVRGEKGETNYKDGYLDYTSKVCKLYKKADNDSLDFYKVIEVRLYHIRENY